MNTGTIFYTIKSWLLTITNPENLTDILIVLGLIGWSLALLAIITGLIYAVSFGRRLAKLAREMKSRTLPRALAEDGDLKFNCKLSLGQLDDQLQIREKELHHDLERIGSDVQGRAIIEHLQDEVREKMANLNGAYNEVRARLAVAYRGLGHFRGEISPEALSQARESLERGLTGPAAGSLQMVLDKGTSDQSRAFYLLGVLAEARLDYLHAAQNYYKAAKLQTSNPVYLTAAGELAYYLWDYAEAEKLLKSAVAIQEKLLGSEHPQVARLLNHLGSIHCAQGRYEEAAALYQWSLEIDEKAYGPDHPVVGELLENYADLLAKIGRQDEAAPMAARAQTIREKHGKKPAAAEAPSA